MPNWCMNKLEISGRKEQIDEIEWFLNERKGEDFFDFFVPNAKAAGMETEWYSYNLETYGCKWNCTAHTFLRENDSTIMIHFDSPWGPPTILYDTINESGDFDDVIATYWEPGMAFIGEWYNGNDSTYEYSDLESLDFIPEELVEEYGLRELMEEYASQLDADEDNV